MRRRANRGSVLLALLVSSALVALILLRTVAGATRMHRALSDERRAARVRELDGKARMERVSSDRERSAVATSCDVGMAESLCAAFDRPPRTTFWSYWIPVDISRGGPLFDYNALFTEATPCPLSGARRICTSLGKEPVLGDMEVSSDTSIVAFGQVTVGATGTMVLEGTLRTAAPLLLVAGGDVTIASLESLPGLSITIVAPRGVVTLRAVSGAPRLTVYSSKSPELPIGAIPGSSVRPLSPLPILVLGLVDDRE